MNRERMNECKIAKNNLFARFKNKTKESVIIQRGMMNKLFISLLHMLPSKDQAKAEEELATWEVLNTM